jgi:aldose 1-epimerase
MRFQITTNAENGWHNLLLTDTQTGTSVEVIPDAGGILNAFTVQHDGRSVNLVEGYHNMQDWNENKTKGFRSAKMSPYVCRVSESTYAWEGKSYHLNKFMLNGIAIHGILYDAGFHVVERLSSQDHAEVELKYAYKGEEPGYPFAYDCLIKYRLDKDNQLTISTLIHNHDQRPIPVCDGWHPYFTFGGSVNGLTLKVATDAMLEYDEAIIPTGHTLPVEGFREGLVIGDRHFDNGYVLDPGSAQPRAVLSDPASGLSIEFHPDAHYPYLQVYTPPHRNSVAIENLSAAPDAFNNGMGLVTLKPNESRVFSTKLKVNVPFN